MRLIDRIPGYSDKCMRKHGKSAYYISLLLPLLGIATFCIIFLPPLKQADQLLSDESTRYEAQLEMVDLAKSRPLSEKEAAELKAGLTIAQASGKFILELLPIFCTFVIAIFISFLAACSLQAKINSLLERLDEVKD
ncbi:hypothetical protein [Persicirhabdus sediminis]|uniref:Uncharacterized protein n=1 Tax=Persicirhabdus sediminis TaxID=454144 RepID=A0A8J7SIB8_9BACT|nr:hypothetical protein [Persicirhabdus sediminis]MBK1790331.1 hypothetical protein [Persicirhabdus sediminis]